MSCVLHTLPKALGQFDVLLIERRWLGWILLR